MSRFPRTPQEAFLRRKELKDDDGKQGYQETFLLYQIILMHSWETGTCNKTIGKLCKIYDLDYHNTYRRAKILREKGWVEIEDGYIRPLFIYLKSDETGVKTTPENGVKITPGSVKITPNDGVKITTERCKIYTNSGENGVNFTPQNQTTGASSIVSSDSRFNLELNQDLNTTSSSNSNGHLSKFSIEDCLRYVEIRIAKGERIETPHKFAKWLFQSGSDDVFIRATLYPEKPEMVSPAMPSEPQTSEETDFDFQPEPLNDQTRETVLASFRFMAEKAGGAEGLQCFADGYLPEDWTWLMGELKR